MSHGKPLEAVSPAPFFALLHRVSVGKQPRTITDKRPVSQPAVLAAKIAFLSFLASESSIAYIPSKCSKYGVFSARDNVKYTTLRNG